MDISALAHPCALGSTALGCGGYGTQAHWTTCSETGNRIQLRKPPLPTARAKRIRIFSLPLVPTHCSLSKETPQLRLTRWLSSTPHDIHPTFDHWNEHAECLRSTHAMRFSKSHLPLLPHYFTSHRSKVSTLAVSAPLESGILSLSNVKVIVAVHKGSGCMPS